MENKVFDLIEKMYIDIKGRFDNVDKRFDKIERGQEDLDNRMTKLEIKIENDLSRKFDSLFEFRDITNENLERIENKIDSLSNKVDKHDIRLEVIENSRKKTS